MEKLEILISNEVIDYLNKLILTLFLKDYFSNVANAEFYVQNIYDFINFDLHKAISKKTPPILEKHGSFYVFYRPNKHTTWYIFFEKKDTRVLITHITNSHLEEVKFLN